MPALFCATLTRCMLAYVAPRPHALRLLPTWAAQAALRTSVGVASTPASPNATFPCFARMVLLATGSPDATFWFCANGTLGNRFSKWCSSLFPAQFIMTHRICARRREMGRLQSELGGALQCWTAPPLVYSDAPVSCLWA